MRNHVKSPLLKDYLDELADLLRHVPKDRRTEILDGVIEHFEAEAPLTDTEAQQLIDRMGSPHEVLEESGEIPARSAYNAKRRKRTLVGTAAAAVVLIVFVVTQFSIVRAPSASMVGAIKIGDHRLLDKVSYRISNPKAGDIVAINGDARWWFPDTADAHGEGLGFKRVVAVAGQTIEAHDGHVYVGGQQLDEPYLPEGVSTSDFPAVTVPQGSIFVLGDNRLNSQDSRNLGTLPVGEVKGKIR